MITSTDCDAIIKLGKCRGWAELRVALPHLPDEPPELWLAHMSSLHADDRAAVVAAVHNDFLQDALLAFFDSNAVGEIQQLPDLEQRRGAFQDLSTSCLIDHWIATMRAAGVSGTERWRHAACDRRRDQDDLADLIAEADFATTVSTSGIEVEMMPGGRVGPDILLRLADAQIYTEVCRVRPDLVQRQALSEALAASHIVPYGNADVDIQKVLSAITGKSRQGKTVPKECAYLVVIVSGKESVEEIEFLKAARHLQDEAEREGATYSAISAVLFNHGYRNLRTGQQYYLWENPNAKASLPPGLVPHLTRM